MAFYGKADGGCRIRAPILGCSQYRLWLQLLKVGDLVSLFPRSTSADGKKRNGDEGLLLCGPVTCCSRMNDLKGWDPVFA